MEFCTTQLLNPNTDINHLCRICLQNAEIRDALDLFAEVDESKDILTKLQLCFQIDLKNQDYFPNIICGYCASELEIAHNFRLKCVSSQEKLLETCKQFSENLKDEIKEENETDYSVDYDCNSFKNSDFSYTIDKSIEGHNEIKSSFKCSTCERVFKKKTSLVRHNISMHQNRRHVGRVTGYGATRRYHCTKCSYSTPYSQTLVTHVRRHTGEKPYVCECGKRFADASSFGSHLKIHSTATYFTCSICGKQFKFAKALRQHLRCHENGKYSCEICKKVLKSRQTLQDHTRRHFNIRNFNCEDCGETFVTSSELIHHKEKHSTEKNLECHLCGYKTLRRRNLIVHLQRHANDRPYKCELCDASFYTRPDVRRHQRVHSQEKAFLCPTCPKGFTRKPALCKHIEAVHKEDLRDHKANVCLKTNPEKLNNGCSTEFVPSSSQLVEQSNNQGIIGIENSHNSQLLVTTQILQ